MRSRAGSARPRDGCKAQLRVALIGYGLAGSAFHAPFIAATPGLELATVVTSRAEAVRERYPDATVAGSPVWEGHDLAVIASPNRTHVPLAREALEAGLGVVVDKPLASSAEAGRELATLAEERGLLLTVFHNRRWDGDFLTLQGLLEQGALGKAFRFESRFERWRPEVNTEGWRERAEPEEAGGVLFDLGSHLIDQALVLFGEAECVYADVESRRPGAQVDDDSYVVLEHSSKVSSHLWMSQAAAQPGPRFRALGSEGAYVKWGLDVQEAALRAGTDPGGPDWGREPEESWGVLGTEDDGHRVETEPGNYAAFYAQIAAGGAPPVPAADAVRVLELIEAAFELSHSGKGTT